MRDARGRWHRSGQGLRRGILLGLRETAKSIAAGPELACGSDSRPCRNNAVSRSPSSNHPTESLPGAMPPSSGVPQPHPPTKPQKPHRLHPLPGPMPPPLASLSIPTKKTAPGSSNTARHRNQNTRQTDLYNI